MAPEHVKYLLYHATMNRNFKRQSKQQRQSRRPRNPRPRRRSNVPQGYQVIHYNPRANLHNPLPEQYFTKFTASGFCYTTFAAGSGDYNWGLKLNSIAAPFATMTTGLTWNNLTPSTYQVPGSGSLISNTMYTQWVVYRALFEIDVVPQSVADSCVATLTPSTALGLPSSVANAMTRPFTVTQRFASGRTYRLQDYPLKLKFSSWQLIGIPQFLYLNDVSGNYVGEVSSSLPTDPPVLQPVTLNIETGDNAILTSPLEISVRVTYWVKLYGLHTAQLA
jgi:hypothetical protein